MHNVNIVINFIKKHMLSKFIKFKSPIRLNQYNIVLVALFYILLSFPTALLAANKIYRHNVYSDRKEFMRDVLHGTININSVTDDGTTALIYAVYESKTDQVKKLLDSNADPNIADNGKVTALIMASQSGHDEIVKILLSNGADPNKAGPSGYTPLMYASSYGNAGVVRLLLDAGANYKAENDDGVTALILASYTKHNEIAAVLRNKIENSPGYEKTDKAETMHEKEITEHDQQIILPNLVSYLEKYPSANKTLTFEFIKFKGICRGLTVLWLYYRWLDTQVDIANEHKSNWYMETADMLMKWDRKEKLTAETSASFNKFASLVCALQGTDTTHSDLEEAFPFVNLDTKGKTIKQKYKIVAEVTQEQLSSLLKQIVHDGELIQVIYVDGLDFHVTGLFKQNESYYYYNPNIGEIKTKSFDKIVSIIHKSGNHYNNDKGCLIAFSISSFDEIPHSYHKQKDFLNQIHAPIYDEALIFSAYLGCLDCLEFYLDGGANPSQIPNNQNGLTALMLASARGYSKIVTRLLSDKRVRIDQENASGFTALILASLYGHAKMVELLTKDGHANPNKTDFEGGTPLEYAIMGKHADVVRVLLDNNADWNKKNKFGASPLELAKTFCNKECMKFFREHIQGQGSGLQEHDDL